MDDVLEHPTPLIDRPAKSTTNTEDDDQISDEEDGQGLDWSRIQPQKSAGAAKPVIPKRGEKEFEPNAGGGSGLQLHILDRSRQAMFNTLRTARRTSSKVISYAVWYPDIARSHVLAAKGVHFTSMGHSAPRSANKDEIEKQHKRLELLPEETIYLVERGSLLCYKDWSSRLHESGLDHIAGSPMTVQQVYSEMLGKEGITLERLQVYTYLRRLGYGVMRANPPDSYYPIPPPYDNVKRPTSQNLAVTRWMSPFTWISWIGTLFSRACFDWWHPIRIGGWLSHNTSYSSIFKSMRIIRAGHDSYITPLPRSCLPAPAQYQIFYNVYKPTTSLKKSAPCPPDFHVVVVNARTTPMPTLAELENLFGLVPESRPPLPRQRQPINQTKPATNEPSKAVVPTAPKLSLFVRLFPWLFPSTHTKNTGTQEPQRRPNPFAALKAGKKMVVIAAVDNGNISFFRFGQGGFEDWPMV